MKKCALCKNKEHHFTEHLKRVDIEKLHPGDVVFVRAVVKNASIGDWSTMIEVSQFEPGFPPKWYWDANVNSVDVFDIKQVLK